MSNTPNRWNSGKSATLFSGSKQQGGGFSTSPQQPQQRAAAPQKTSRNGKPKQTVSRNDQPAFGGLGFQNTTTNAAPIQPAYNNIGLSRPTTNNNNNSNNNTSGPSTSNGWNMSGFSSNLSNSGASSGSGWAVDTSFGSPVQTTQSTTTPNRSTASSRGRSPYSRGGGSIGRARRGGAASSVRGLSSPPAHLNTSWGQEVMKSGKKNKKKDNTKNVSDANGNSKKSSSSSTDASSKRSGDGNNNNNNRREGGGNNNRRYKPVEMKKIKIGDREINVIDEPEQPDESAVEEAQAAIQDEMDAIDARIEEINASLEEISAQRKAQLQDREAKFNELREIRNTKSQLLAGAQQTNLRIQELEGFRMERRKESQDMKRGLRYYVRAELETAIKALEAQLAKRGLPLGQEKKLTMELQILQSQRAGTSRYEDHLKSDGGDRKNDDSAAAKLKSERSNAMKKTNELKKREEALQKVLDKEMNADRKLRKEEDNLYKELKKATDKRHKKRRNLERAQYKLQDQQRLWKRWLDQEKFIQQIQRRQEKEKQWEEERNADEQREVEAKASVDPFAKHKLAISDLIAFLHRWQTENGGGAVGSTSNGQATAEETSASDLAKARAGEGKEGKKGVTKLQRAVVAEQLMLVDSPTNASKPKKQRKRHKKAATFVTMDTETIQSFTLVGVSPPLYAKDVDLCVEKLEAKKVYYESGAAAKAKKSGKKSKSSKTSSSAPAAAPAAEMEPEETPEQVAENEAARQESRAQADRAVREEQERRVKEQKEAELNEARRVAKERQDNQRRASNVMDLERTQRIKDEAERKATEEKREAQERLVNQKNADAAMRAEQARRDEERRAEVAASERALEEERAANQKRAAESVRVEQARRDEERKAEVAASERAAEEERAANQKNAAALVEAEQKARVAEAQANATEDADTIAQRAKETSDAVEAERKRQVADGVNNDVQRDLKRRRSSVLQEMAKTGLVTDFNAEEGVETVTEEEEEKTAIEDEQPNEEEAGTPVLSEEEA